MKGGGLSYPVYAIKASDAAGGRRGLEATLL